MIEFLTKMPSLGWYACQQKKKPHSGARMPGWSSVGVLVPKLKIDYFYSMSTKYKFRDSQKLYFISYANVHWIDVFIRVEYSQIWVDSVNYCSAHKDLEVYAYCLMPSHVHMIVSSPTGQLSNIMRDLKKHTSLKIIEAIQLNSQESRKE